MPATATMPTLCYVWDEGDGFYQVSPAEVGNADDYVEQGDACLACDGLFHPYDVVIATDAGGEGEYVSHLICQVTNPQVTLCHLTDAEAAALCEPARGRHAA